MNRPGASHAKDTCFVFAVVVFCRALSPLLRQHLEAEMGMINHRHNHLRIECQALLRVVLLEGGKPLAEKAVSALRQLVRELLSLVHTRNLRR